MVGTVHELLVDLVPRDGSGPVGVDHCQSNNHPVCMMMLPYLVLHNIFVSRTKQTKCLLANLANLGENFLPPGALDPSWDVEQDGVSPFWPW